MSMFPDRELGFFDTVQFYFTELTGKAALLSGRDLELLSRWRRAGASARTICKGVREAVEAMPDDDPPRSIWACRSYIEPHVERAAERGAGRNTHDDDPSQAREAKATDTRADETEPSDDPADDPTEPGAERSQFEYAVIGRTLDKIEQAGRACDNQARRQVYRQAWRQVRELGEEARGGDDVDRSDAFEELAAIEEALVEAFFRALDDEARARIRRRIRRNHGDLLENMSGEARRDHILARKRRILIEEYELQPLLG